jgi:hypothetical protein
MVNISGAHRSLVLFAYMHVYSIPACMPYAWGVAFVCIFIYRILDGDMPRVQHPYVVAPKNKRVSRVVRVRVCRVQYKYRVEFAKYGIHACMSRDTKQLLASCCFQKKKKEAR